MMQRRYINRLSKAITGTLVYIMAALLTKMGMLIGADDERDKDVRDFKRNAMGFNAFSIRLLGNSYSYDWMQPIGGILAMGATSTALIDQNRKNKSPESDMAILLQGIKAAGNTVLERSFLQGIQEFFGNDDFFTSIGNVFLDIPQQLFSPTFIKQIADIVDDNAREVYVAGDAIGNTARSFRNRTPGLSKSLEPKIDVLGRDVLRYGGEKQHI